MAGRLEGKSVVITGGAIGIRESAVRLFASEGARVILADILDAEGQTIAGELWQDCCCHGRQYPLIPIIGWRSRDLLME